MAVWDPFREFARIEREMRRMPIAKVARSSSFSGKTFTTDGASRSVSRGTRSGPH